VDFILEDFCQTDLDDAISYVTELQYTRREEFFSGTDYDEIYRKSPPIDDMKQITNILSLSHEAQASNEFWNLQKTWWIHICVGGLKFIFQTLFSPSVHT